MDSSYVIRSIKILFAMQILLGLSITTALLLTKAYSYRLDEDASKEMECIPPPNPKDIPVDMKWFGSVETFYVPLWSKFYAHRTAGDLLQKEVKMINAEEMGPSSCLMMKKDQSVSGFGKVGKYNLSGDATSITFKAHWKGAKSAKYSFHLTDNKSWVLGVTCWEDHLSGWAVMSNRPMLETSAKMRIIQYIKTLGFSDDLAVEEDYGFCELDININNEDKKTTSGNACSPCMSPPPPMAYYPVFYAQPQYFNPYYGMPKYYPLGHHTKY